MISASEILACLELGIIYGITAIGLYITFRIINFQDLTCEGSFTLGCAVTAVLISNGVNPYVATIIASIVGGVSGFFTGVLNIVFKISDLLSGILIAFMLYSINLRIMNGIPNIPILDCETIFQSDILVKLLLIFSFICISIFYYFSTDNGLALRSVGQNKIFARAYGVNTNVMTFFGLSLSNALIALSGALFSQYQGFSDISQGQGSLVISLAAIIIAEKIMKKNFIPFFTIFCLVGSTIYRFFIAIALRFDSFGIQTQDINLITGILIIISMTLKKRSKKNA